MHEVAEQHLARLRQATVSKLGRKDLALWIEQNTYLAGKKFTFRGHEFQKRILSEDAPSIVVRKAAQTGVSELSLRMAAAMVMVMPAPFRIGYVLPSATFASSYAQTRFNPIVQTSPALRTAVSTDDIDRADIKTFGNGREVYFKGAAVGNSAISTTLDCLIFDEKSFCSEEVIGDYHSRLIHSKYKWTIALSTPTYPGDPIDSDFQASRRHWNLCKCQHCGHSFVPDFYENVRVPGWDKHLDEISKDNLHLVRHREAVFFCPACKKVTSLQPQHREWVCENPEEDHIAVGFQVQPFDSPDIVTLSDLIIASTKYATKAKFKQFSLGRPAADSDSGLTAEDIDAMGVEMESSPFSTHVAAYDMGMTCHCAIGGTDAEGRLVVVHYERIPLARFRERYFHLKAEYRVSITVMDSQPYLDMVMSLSDEDPNLYGGVYVTRQGLELFDVKQREADPDNALAGIRQVQINRNAVFDKFLADVRSGKVVIRKRQDWELLKAHLQDMRRASAALRTGEFTSVWQKSSKGNDHYHHTLAAYLATAAQMRGIASGAFSGAPLVSTFRLRKKG